MASSPSDDPGRDLLRAVSDASWPVALALGVGSLVLGVIVLAWPGETVVVVGVLFGLYLLVSGIVQLVHAAGDRYSGGMRAMVFLSGALAVLLGLLCFRGATQSVTLLGLWIGIGWLFRGVYELADATSSPGRDTGWLVFFGLLNVAAGMVLIVEPVGSVIVLAVVAGCWLLVLGSAELVTAVRLHGVARGRTPLR